VTNGTVDGHGIASERGLDRHLLDAGTQIGHQGAFRGQRADMDGLKTSLIDQYRYFYTGSLGQIGNQVRIGDVAVELEGFAAL